MPITILPSGLSWPLLGCKLPFLRIISVCFDVYFAFVKEGKEFRNRPGVAQRVPGGLGSQISMTFGT
jgi:hypothetical protein